MASLTDIEQRLSRADKGLGALEEQVRDFIQSGEACVASHEKDGEMLMFEVAPQSPPEAVVKRAGEIAAELWAVVVELVSLLADEPLADFPICHSPEEFAAWMDAHLPQVGEKERAIVERFQPHEAADWVSPLKRIAKDHATGQLKGVVWIDGNIRPTWPMEPDADAPERPVTYRIDPQSPIAQSHFNVHMHVAIAVEISVGTPLSVEEALGQAHTEIQTLIENLDLPPDSG